MCSDTHLHQHGRPKVLVTVPPVAGAARTAAGAQDTFIQAILQKKERIIFKSVSTIKTTIKTSWMYQFLSVLYRLQVLLLAFIGLVPLLQVRLNRLVLSIEVTHVLQTQTLWSV